MNASSLRRPQSISATIGRTPDPEMLHNAAAFLGNLVGRGLADYDECMDVLTSAAIRNHPHLTFPTEFPIANRLFRTLITASDAATLTPAAEIREAIRPLIAQRASRPEILLAAHAAGRGRMPPAEILSIAADEVAQAMKRAPVNLSRAAPTAPHIADPSRPRAPAPMQRRRG